MSKSVRAGWLAAALFLVSGAASAQTVIRYVDAGSLATILKEVGTRDVTVRSGSNDHIVEGTYNGVPVALALTDCDNANHCSQVGCTAYFGKQEVTPQWVIAFNKNHPVRIVFRGSGEAALYYEIFLDGGVTLDHVRLSTKRFLDSIALAETYKLEE